jgi:ABC-type transporter Mla subunit MlaD
MSIDTVGASLSDLEGLKALLTAKASEVQQLISDITTQVGDAGAPGSVHWVGAVADQFRGEWSNTFRPNLNHLIEALSSTASYVEANRSAIDRALNGVG